MHHREPRKEVRLLRLHRGIAVGPRTISDIPEAGLASAGRPLVLDSRFENLINLIRKLSQDVYGARYIFLAYQELFVFLKYRLATRELDIRPAMIV